MTTYNLLDMVATLKRVGVSQEQSEEIVRVITQAQERLVTSEHLTATLHQELAPLKTDLAVLKWMMGVLLAGVVALVLKTFFP